MQEISRDTIYQVKLTPLQLVWVASTKVGFGVASDGNQKHVVARYSPRGNFGGNADYEANVLPAGSTGTDGGSSGGSGSGSGGECTTEVHSYSDTIGTGPKCHYRQASL